MKALILENGKDIDPIITSYIERDEFDGWEFEYIDLMRTNPTDIFTKLTNADAYFLSSTFSNAEQNGQLFDIFRQLQGPKQFYIYSSADRLSNKLVKVLPSDFHPAPYDFEDNDIYEIAVSQRIKPSSGAFFKDYQYYFDTIKYYWNDRYACYFPERPTCFYEDNLNPVYKYKPKFIKK